MNIIQPIGHAASTPRQFGVSPGYRVKGAGFRVMMYSHDSWGLGHLRRSLAIAGAITAANPRANVLLLSGSPCATQFHLPDRVDIVKLPAVTKNEEGNYAPRCLSGSLDALVDFRARLLVTAFESFEPDVFMVDHHVIGVGGEVLPTLSLAKTRGVHCVLGLRDIIDEPKRVNRDLNNPDCQWALQEAYDQVFVYGSPAVFDPREAYSSLGAVQDRIEFTGYVTPASISPIPSPVPTLRPQVLVTCGGGEDGRERVECYLDAERRQLNDWETVIVTGPLMPREWTASLRRAARSRPNVVVHEFADNLPQLIRAADAIVSMAGYNASAELLASRKPCVLLPRTQPRQEQLIRAQRFSALGLARYITELDSKQLADSLASALSNPLNGITPPLGGLDYVCRSLPDLLPIKRSLGPSFFNSSRRQVMAAPAL